MPDYYCMDGTIPKKQLPYVLKRIDELSEQFNLNAPMFSMPVTATCIR